MRMRFAWALLALLVAPCLPARADDEKKPEAKEESSSPSLRIDYDILSDVGEVEPNNAPAQANLLGCGNTFRPAAIAVQAPRDTDWISFTANAGDVILFGTDADGPTPIGDTRISILSNNGTTVLGTDDDGGPGQYSLVSMCAPYTGTYYGRIAAFGSQTGTYMAFLTCSPSSAPNDQCAGAITIPCGSIDLFGSTADACPNYSLPEGGCTGFFANGRDVAYKVNVVAGDSLYLDYVQSGADASIYMVTDCSNPAGTCVVGEDSTLVGGHETLAYKFTSDGTYYIILDSFSPGSGGPWTATGLLTCFPDQIDSLGTAHADIDLEGPWGTERIALNGSMTLASTVHALQEGFSGTDFIPTEITQLELTGNSLNVGPVTLRLRAANLDPFQRSAGPITEWVNSTPGVLDLPPLAPDGTAYAQISTFVEVELPVLKLLLHNNSSAQMAGDITHLPPGDGDSLSGGNIQLVDSNQGPTPYVLHYLRLTPNPETAVEVLANPRMTVDLQGPLGLDTVTLKGTTVVEMQLGNLGDTDGDGLEQVGLKVPTMNLSGFSALYGPIHASLNHPTPHPLPATTGEIEENVNTETARLDLPPFVGSGTASSNFDLFFRMEIDNIKYHNHVAKHMIGTLTQLPAAVGEQYRNFVPTPLIDDNDAPSPYTARRMFFTPIDVTPTGTQRDSFPQSRLALEVNGPWGFDQLFFTGPTKTELYLGLPVDSDDDQLEELGMRITQMTLTAPGGVYGHIPGPVTIFLSDSSAVGQVEESVNYTPGLLDLPPFAVAGAGEADVDSFQVFVDIPGQPTLHLLSPVELAATLHRAPAGPGDTYQVSGEIPLVDAGEASSGMAVMALRLTLLSGGPLDVPGTDAAPTALAIREIRPNPTSAGATVTLALPRHGNARLAAYDLNGRLVRTLWNGEMDAGMRTIAWDGRTDRGDRAPGGIYFLRLESASMHAVKRLAILR